MNKEELPVIPPETHYLSAKYVLEIPTGDNHLKDPWQLRLHALKLVQHKIGDEVQLTALRVKKPSPAKKALAKLLKREPGVRLYVTVKF